MPKYVPDLSPAERHREIAKLLATALLRFHRRIPRSPTNSKESSQTGLDAGRESRLSVATGSAGEHRQRTRERQP
jgi:hypothetical protein